MKGTPDSVTSEEESAANAEIQIPGYEIKRQLGRGGMAFVYLAIQESFGREVALKVLAPDHAQDKEFSERFLREARIISQLVHPNIVTVYDVGIHEGYHYLSMEYIRGRDLQEACRSLAEARLSISFAMSPKHLSMRINKDTSTVMLNRKTSCCMMMDAYC